MIAGETSFYFNFFIFSVTLIRAGWRKEIEAPGTREKIGARKVAQCGGDSQVEGGRYSSAYRQNSNDIQTLGMTTNTFAAELSLGQVSAHRKTTPSGPTSNHTSQPPYELVANPGTTLPPMLLTRFPEFFYSLTSTELICPLPMDTTPSALLIISSWPWYYRFSILVKYALRSNSTINALSHTLRTELVEDFTCLCPRDTCTRIIISTTLQPPAIELHRQPASGHPLNPLCCAHRLYYSFRSQGHHQTHRNQGMHPSSRITQILTHTS